MTGMQLSAKPKQPLRLLAGVAAGVLLWLLLQWLASTRGGVLVHPPWVARLAEALGVVLYLIAGWACLLGWQKGLPPFAPLLLLSGAAISMGARGAVNTVIGASCLFVGALAAQPRSVPVAVRRCIVLAAVLVIVSSIADL